MVVGAPGHNAAYVYMRPQAGWQDATEMAELYASDGGGQLGQSVAINAEGELVVAGASAPYLAGAAYLFVQPSDVWQNTTQIAKLTASDGLARDQLGVSVAIDASGDTVVAGAPFHPGIDPDQGAAYVFQQPYGGWTDTTQAAKLTASDGEEYDQFGFSVALSRDGNTAAVGAPHHGLYHSLIVAGAAYAYRKPSGGWIDASETAKLMASDHGGLLGWSMALAEDGSTVVAGTPYYDGVGLLRGTADIFGSSPLAVTLAGFWVEPRNHSLLVAWETVSEVDTLGFNLYRSDAGEPSSFAQLNDELIPSQAPGTTTGAVYHWLDADVAAGHTYFYLLEDVDMRGRATRHGPASATAPSTARLWVYLPLVAR